jgi:hypothetical protein
MSALTVTFCRNVEKRLKLNGDAKLSGISHGTWASPEDVVERHETVCCSRDQGINLLTDPSKEDDVRCRVTGQGIQPVDNS